MAEVWSMQLSHLRAEIEERRGRIFRQRKEIQALKRAEINTASAEELLERMLAKVDELCAERDRQVGQCRIGKRA
jgi:sRNA-binding protein